MASLVYDRRGHGDPLVLIHGIGSRWQIWEPVLGGLEPHRDVIALDLPGFGASPMPTPGTPAGVDSLVRLVGAFLTELGIERPHVAGNSLGGLVVLEMARRGLVRSATALSPAGFATRAETLAARANLRLSLAVSRRLAARADRLLRSRAARRVAFSATVAHPTRMSPADAAANLRGLAHAPWFEATLSTVGPMAFSGGGAIAVPVTIGWGRKDRLLLPRQARRAAREIPHARIVMLADCGHVPTYDDPALVTRVLLEGSRGP
ncbi:MAG: alpha/beta fold hydrolase [Actinomycetota bacterium]|nr:alpha/beta fold hydrolase [Actinomycetota bacterium]